LLHHPESRVAAKFVGAYPTEYDATRVPSRLDPLSVVAGFITVAVALLIVVGVVMPAPDTPAHEAAVNAWTSVIPVAYLFMIIFGMMLGTWHPVARLRILLYKALRRIHLISTVPVPAQEGFVDVAELYHLPIKGYWWTKGPAPTLGQVLNRYHSPITADWDLALLAHGAPEIVARRLNDALRLLGRRLAIREIILSGHVDTLDEVARARLLREARELRALAA
jgi:hypothetical protein